MIQFYANYFQVFKLMIFFLLYFQKFEDEKETYIMCTFLETDFISKSTYQICFVLSSYVIPLVVISGLYIALIMRLWQSSSGGVRMSAESRSGRKRVTRLVVVVVVAFASLWFPIQVSFISFFMFCPKTNEITSIFFLFHVHHRQFYYWKVLDGKQRHRLR